MASFRQKHGRKLLLASIGVATVTYIGCEDTMTSGNLMAPPCTFDGTCDSSSSSSTGGGQGGQAGEGGKGGAGGVGGMGGQGGIGGAGGAGGKPDGGM